MEMTFIILEVAIARIRKRLVDGSGDYNYIGTRRGVEYFFSAPSAGFPSSAAFFAAAQQWNHVRRRRPALVPPSQLPPVMQRHQRSADGVIRHAASWE